MNRIWIYIRESTIDAAITALNRLRNLRYFRHENSAAEDLKLARKLSKTGATREEIEHVSAKHDEENPP